MKKGVIYARYSCDKQTDNSTKAQIRECSEWAKKNNITIIDSYIDEAISGRTDKRPAFQKMIQDAQRGYFECIIVWKGDRFSRSRADAAKYKTLLKKCNVRVLSVTEPNIEGPQAILMDGINEAFAEYYSVELAAKIIRGQDQNAIEGKWNGGSVPYGYDHDPKTQLLSINEEEAKVVREVYRLYLEDNLSTTKIADILAERGIVTKKGNPISRAGVYHILTHENYIGIYHWRKYVLNNIFPPILDEDTYNKAQEKLKKNGVKRGIKKGGIAYLLTGRVFCGKCGEILTGTGGTSKLKKRYYYYVCKNKKGGKCDLLQVPKEPLEAAVINIVRREILMTEATRKGAIDYIVGYMREDNPDIPNAEKELAEVNVKIKKVLILMEELDDMEEIIDRLKTLKARKTELEEKIAKMKKQSGTIDREQLEAYFENLATCKFDTLEDKQFLINNFVDSVYVYDDGKIGIFLNYRGHIESFLTKPGVLLSLASVHQPIKSQARCLVFYIQRK